MSADATTDSVFGVAFGLVTVATEGDVGAFAEFLGASPIPVALLLVGALVTGATVALLAYLSVGAVLSALLAAASP